MSNANVVNNTGNQAHIDYDISKIFVWNNRYEDGSLLNASGGVKSFLPGTVMGRIAASGKFVPLVAAATDGSQYPVGILKTNVVDLADAAEQRVYICMAGDVVSDKLIFNASEHVSTVIESRMLGDRIASDTMGIKLVKTDELTGFDNQ